MQASRPMMARAMRSSSRVWPWSWRRTRYLQRFGEGPAPRLAARAGWRGRASARRGVGRRSLRGARLAGALHFLGERGLDVDREVWGEVLVLLVAEALHLHQVGG